jgi:TrmH family RNA methyltransferase
MLSKATQKWIRSLELKKVRQASGCFLAEGHKLVGDLLFKLPCRLLAGTDAWFDRQTNLPETECHRIDESLLQRLSLLRNPQEVLAVFEIPKDTLQPDALTNQLTLALDGIQDPGNLGTIIRIADWFGIEHIVCSNDTVDAFNPKTVQASMGAIGRVRLSYLDLPVFLANTPLPIFGTFLDGSNLYDQALPQAALVVMGNEGNGISPEIERLVQHKILIPDYPMGTTTAESLNVSVATAIVCAEFRRRLTTGV